MKTAHSGQSADLDFPFEIQRDFQDEPIELVAQVTYFRAPDMHGAIDSRDPAADPGEVRFGTISTLDGKTFELTPLEAEALETQFWNQYNS
jgi:hypothetical protein